MTGTGRARTLHVAFFFFGGGRGPRTRRHRCCRGCPGPCRVNTLPRCSASPLARRISTGHASEACARHVRTRLMAHAKGLAAHRRRCANTCSFRTSSGDPGDPGERGESGEPLALGDVAAPAGGRGGASPPAAARARQPVSMPSAAQTSATASLWDPSCICGRLSAFRLTVLARPLVISAAASRRAGVARTEDVISERQPHRQV